MLSQNLCVFFETFYVWHTACCVPWMLISHLVTGCCRNVADKHKGIAGMMAAFSLIFGVLCGIIFSFPMIAVVESFGSSHYEQLVCELPGIAEVAPVNMTSVTVGALDVVSTVPISP